ncbi:MAG: hypothetical protein FD143_3655, partial [Ignavibacteria bacterium]
MSFLSEKNIGAGVREALCAAPSPKLVLKFPKKTGLPKNCMVWESIVGSLIRRPDEDLFHQDKRILGNIVL